MDERGADDGPGERQSRSVIRNAILHLTNEQPLLVDLFEPPRPDDVSLVCTNLRQLNGQGPIFVERSDSIFVFPYGQIRFLEVPAAATEVAADYRPPGATERANPKDLPGATEGTDELELDPAFLERIRDL